MNHFLEPSLLDWTARLRRDWLSDNLSRFLSPSLRMTCLHTISISKTRRTSRPLHHPSKKEKRPEAVIDFSSHTKTRTGLASASAS